MPWPLLHFNRVPLEKKIKINTNKDKYNVKEVINLRKEENVFKYLIK